MTTSISCGWCHTMNVLTGQPVTCRVCGHRGDLLRFECDCLQCRFPMTDLHLCILTPDQARAMLSEALDEPPSAQPGRGSSAP